MEGVYEYAASSSAHRGDHLFIEILGSSEIQSDRLMIAISLSASRPENADRGANASQRPEACDRLTDIMQQNGRALFPCRIW